MPSRLRNFAELRVLDLSYNKLQVLPNNFFTEDNKLEIFNLSNNYLHQVGSGAFNGLQHLMVLDLERNELKTIPEDVFLPLTNVISSQGEICLSRNRWKCGCTLWGFMAWFLDHQNTVSWNSTNDEETVCRTPEGLSNRRLHSLSLSELGNCFPTTSVANPTSTTQNDITTTLSITTENIYTRKNPGPLPF
ncbi:putative platelet glycoprotein V [Apostichopus japonicus]|uniref:Putative platelet glycoprotein V n=1 Tax=Stichopus japonicus TaxID=307972 RepID=A0A2G8KZA0_STIJA|nr:putative platelet glycoprotein V [Apostichopus japonicus]